MTRKSFGHIAGLSEPVADAVYFQPPTRIRDRWDREITHEVIEDAIRRFRKAGGKIRRVHGIVATVEMQRVGGKSKEFKVVGYHEVDIEADAELARSGI